MTHDEAYAIEILQEERDWAQQLSYVNEALDMAIKALEKQIPKKPIHKREEFPTHDWVKNSDGSIDEWAVDCGFHNGPMCKRCGHSFCVHCVEDVEKELSATCEYSYYLCPTCGEEVDYKEHHCKCGQAIEWE